ncbi:MAG TPA: hypothetical protein RMF84_15910 [Polyangiaceae bacterium LLY-WYZ-14_1]|nr:hypothetical protein [Polyangiaceae bacterium LLY-WYZ-14_1]
MSRIALAILGLGLFLLTPMLVLDWIGDAKARLPGQASNLAPTGEDGSGEVAVAAAAHADYCNPELQKVLRRVLQSCGLGEGREGGGAGRGCQPVEAKTVATMRGDDFNALFLPMAERASIVQFAKNDALLDPRDREVVEDTFADRRGASWFFVVARASPEGDVAYNRELSRRRAEAVMDHLRQTFDDPDLDRQVGLLWLGEEYAQLDAARFCDWTRSGEPADCQPEDLNRSAFLAWIDCRL